MESLKYIFAQPDYIDGVDKKHPISIYPIKLKDYDKFQECSKLLHISKSHFQDSEYPLLGLLFMCREQLGYEYEELIKTLSNLFSIVTHQEVNFINGENIQGFLIDGLNLISIHNYDTIRTIIMKQNLIFEPKVYKNPIIQEWANKVLASKAKASSSITIEDLITTVSNYKKVSYSDLMEFSLYQLHADFYRISKIMAFEQSSLFATVSSEKITIESFAASIDIFHNPYEDLFVDSNKLNKLNSLAK